MAELTKCFGCGAPLISEEKVHEMKTGASTSLLTEISLQINLDATVLTGLEPITFEPIKLKTFSLPYCRTCAISGLVPFLDENEVKALLSKQS